MSNPDTDKQNQARPQHEADRKKPAKGNPVLFYLMILFAAAFLLLLMSFLMQRRANEEAINNLQHTSDSATQSLANTIAQNESLTKQVEELQTTLAQQEETLQEQEQSLAELEQQVSDLTKASQALDWFWQINEAYTRGRYTQARSLIEDMGDELPQYLPKESVTDNGRFSPYDRYQEIYEALY